MPQLSCTIPKTISLPFNPSASRNMLAAAQRDIISAIASAKPVQAPLVASRPRALCPPPLL
jgi:hypothetical protein